MCAINALRWVPRHRGAVYRIAPNWKEEHVLSHLANARGILQADGYKGYAKLYEPEPNGGPTKSGAPTTTLIFCRVCRTRVYHPE